MFELGRASRFELEASTLATSRSTSWAIPALNCDGGVQYGIRTRVLTLKGWCPRPLDESDKARFFVELRRGFEPLFPGRKPGVLGL